MNKHCDICNGSGWVCENHLSTPWGDKPGECECGAGTSCVCNPSGDVDWALVIASTDPKEITPMH